LQCVLALEPPSKVYILLPSLFHLLVRRVVEAGDNVRNIPDLVETFRIGKFVVSVRIGCPNLSQAAELGEISFLQGLGSFVESMSGEMLLFW
jgi:hypothetical protein